MGLEPEETGETVDPKPESSMNDVDAYPLQRFDADDPTKRGEIGRATTR